MDVPDTRHNNPGDSKWSFITWLHSPYIMAQKLWENTILFHAFLRPFGRIAIIAKTVQTVNLDNTESIKLGEKTKKTVVQEICTSFGVNRCRVAK